MTKTQSNRKANEQKNEVEYTFPTKKLADQFRNDMCGREYEHDDGADVVWVLTRTKTAYRHNEALFKELTS